MFVIQLKSPDLKKKQENAALNEKKKKKAFKST